MKKIVLALCIMALVLSAAACSNNTATTQAETKPTAATSATENATIATEPTEAPTEKETTDKNGDKNKDDDKKENEDKEDNAESKSEDSSSSGAASVSSGSSSGSSGNGNTASANNAKSAVNNNSGNNTTQQSSSNNSNKSNTSSSSAQTSKVWHEAVYKYVEHPAETKKVWVVDVPASTKEEPVYEEQGRAICTTCNADITDDIDSHLKKYMATDSPHHGYRVVLEDVQVGTKTVNVPAKGHYETQTVKKAWTEKILVREAGYY